MIFIFLDLQFNFSEKWIHTSIAFESAFDGLGNHKELPLRIIRETLVEVQTGGDRGFDAGIAMTHRRSSSSLNKKFDTPLRCF